MLLGSYCIDGMFLWGVAAARLSVTGRGYGYTVALSGDGCTALMMMLVAVTSFTWGPVDDVHSGRTLLHPHTRLGAVSAETAYYGIHRLIFLNMYSD